VRFSALTAAELADLLTRPASDGADNPARPLERLELASLVQTAVSSLAERQRTALVLHQFHRHTYAQIARRMDMTPKAAKSLLYRARHQLRHSLSKVLEVC
jgi:RNA polymerase sigma factor (sigma-70 family)